MSRRGLLVLVLMMVAGVAVWAAFRLRAARRNQFAQSITESFNPNTTSPDWNVAVEQVKAERDASLGGALDIPPELKHYEERYWFLATQVAEVEKYKVHTVQDYLDLAGMIERRELVPLPAVMPSSGTMPVSAINNWIRDTGTRNSSAAACVSSVRDPCPASTLPVMTVIDPSFPM